MADSMPRYAYGKAAVSPEADPSGSRRALLQVFVQILSMDLPISLKGPFATVAYMTQNPDS